MPLRSLAQRGFTLIELMVVIFIIALVSGMAVISVGQRDDRLFAAEVNRLTLSLQQAADRSLMRQEVLGFSFAERHYGFHRLGGSPLAWQPLDQGEWSDNTLPPGITLTVEPGIAQPHFADDPMDIVFLPDGQYTPFRLELRSGPLTRTLSGDGLSQIARAP